MGLNIHVEVEHLWLIMLCLYDCMNVINRSACCHSFLGSLSTKDESLHDTSMG